MAIMDSATALSFSIFEAKGVYALLLGSGLSRAAEVPTGWEITLDLVRRVALSQGVEEQADWAAWYREETGEEPNYSTLLADLASSPDQRRAILHGYIEPDAADREEGRKVPTQAHAAIAALVAAGYIRVIITTNFDRLLENALREAGVEPTIVASVDALAGAEPIIHSQCYVLKLHGDYKDARILNTDEELSTYPPAYDQLLDRILDEHGLIVAGWSGAWDHALRAAILRAPNRRYATYWTSRGAPAAQAEDLIAHRRANVVPITDADSFFVGLQQRVETLQATLRPNPLSLDLLTGATKRFLARPEHRIQLHDLIDGEFGRLLELLKTEAPNLSNDGPWNTDEWRRRVRFYEGACEGLAAVAGLLGCWGNGSDVAIVRDLVQSLWTDAEENRGGLTAYIGLRSYPAVLIFTAYGISLVRAERWGALHAFLRSPLNRRHDKPSTFVETLYLWAWSGGSNEVWRLFEGLENRKTALSDHLFDVMSAWAPRFLERSTEVELVFERFEMLACLAHFEREDPAEVLGSFATNPQGWAWMPIGRSAWHGEMASRLLAELTSEPMSIALVSAGFCPKPQTMEAFLKNYRALAARVGWG